MNRTGTMLTLLAMAILKAVGDMCAEDIIDTNPYGALTLLNGSKESLCASPADNAFCE